MNRYDLNDIINCVGKAMFALEAWERTIELGLGDALRWEKAMVIRAHLLAEATFDQLKDLRDRAMLNSNPEGLVSRNGKYQALRGRLN